MEQTQGILQKRNYLIAGIVVVLAIGYFVIQRQGPSDSQTDQEQVSGENTNTNSEQTGSETSQNTNDSTNQDQTATSPAASNEIPPVGAGNVEAKGTLQVSDNLSRGNLMLDSNRGKIYVKTNRDFSALLGKEASLAANGNINSFVFLGFNPGSGAGNIAGAATTDITAVGGGDTLPGKVNLSGTLGASDNLSRGKYVINSSAGKVYLQSSHDYSALQGSEVELTANGTINNFTGAALSKK